MIIKKLPLNDTHAQCFRKLQNQTDELITSRRKEMRNCKHLFVLLEDESHERINKGFRTIECVHCGLTNKFIGMEERVLIEYPLYKISLKCDSKQMVETIVFLEMFDNIYEKGSKYFNQLPINLLKDEVLSTNHSTLLYKLALIINPYASLEEIFDIMKMLHSLETSHERTRLQSISEAKDLLERYYEYQNNKQMVLQKIKK